jgi:hypothetical protein
LPSEHVATFEVFFEDPLCSSDSCFLRLDISKRSVAAIIREVMNIEEKRNYDRNGGSIQAVLADKDGVKVKLEKFMNEISANIAKLDKNEPRKYLDIISSINRMTLSL